MSNRKSDEKIADKATAAVTGRVAGLKISQDSCEFHLKNGKNGARHFVVSGAGGVPLNAVIGVLSAAWADRRKISVQPMSGEGMEKTVASISAGDAPKPAKAAPAPKAAKPKKAAKAVEPAVAEAFAA